MKTVVAGGAGFVGGYVVERLLAQGHEVTVLDNLSRGKVSNLPDKGDMRTMDVRYVAALDLRGADRVYDFAARVFGVRTLYSEPADLLAYNLEVTVALLKAAAAAGVRDYVYVSSSCIYDHPKARVPHREDDIGLCDTSYGLSKLVGEELCRYYAQQYDVRVRTVRLFNVYGPRDSFVGAHVIPDFIRKAWRVAKGETREFSIIGDGSQTRDFTWVDDAADAIVVVADKGSPGEAYNVGTGRELTMYALAMKVCDLFGLKMAGGAHVANAGQPYFTFEEAPRQDIQRRSASVVKIARDTGWKPEVGLEEGLRRVKDWLVPKLEVGAADVA